MTSSFKKSHPPTPQNDTVVVSGASELSAAFTLAAAGVDVVGVLVIGRLVHTDTGLRPDESGSRTSCGYSLGPTGREGSSVSS